MAAGQLMSVTPPPSNALTSRQRPPAQVKTWARQTSATSTNIEGELGAVVGPQREAQVVLVAALSADSGGVERRVLAPALAGIRHALRAPAGYDGTFTRQFRQAVTADPFAPTEDCQVPSQSR